MGEIFKRESRTVRIANARYLVHFGMYDGRTRSRLIAYAVAWFYSLRGWHVSIDDTRETP